MRIEYTSAYESSSGCWELTVRLQDTHLGVTQVDDLADAPATVRAYAELALADPINLRANYELVPVVCCDPPVDPPTDHRYAHVPGHPLADVPLAALECARAALRLALADLLTLPGGALAEDAITDDDVDATADAVFMAGLVAYRERLQLAESLLNSGIAKTKGADQS